MDFLLLYYVCWAALFCTLLANLNLDIKLESPTSILWLSLIAVFALPALFDPFNDDSSVLAILGGPSQDLRNNPVLIKAQIFSLLFSLIYYFVRVALAKSEYEQVKKNRVFVAYVHSPETEKALLFFTIILVVGFSLLVMSIAISVGLSGLLGGTYTTFRVDANGPLKMASYYLILAFSGCLFTTIPSKNWTYFYLIILILILVFMAGRTRQLVVPAAIGFFYYVLFHYGGPKKWFGIISLSLVGLVGLFFLQFIRYQGSITDAISAIGTSDFYFSFYASLLEAEGEAAVRHYFYYLLQADIDFEGFQEATSYRRLLFLLTPGSLLREIGLGDIKPIDMSTLIYQDYFGEGIEIVATAHPLVFGDAFANLGWMGVLFGGVLALISSGANIFIRSFPWAWRVAIMSYLGYVFIMIARGGVYNSITGMIFVMMIYFLSYKTYCFFIALTTNRK